MVSRFGVPARVLGLGLALLTVLVSPGAAEELAGEVVAVRGDTVTIELTGQEGAPKSYPYLGDEARLFFEAGGVRVDIGTWRVTRVGPDTVTATKLKAEDEAGPGLPAVIETERPRGRYEVERELEVLDKAEAGDVEAMYDIGNRYTRFIGNHDVALEWLGRAAEAGHGPAMTTLGQMHFAGIGVEKNVERGLAWLRKAMARGDGRAMLVLARLYRQGRGVDANPARAAELIRRAAEAGDHIGMYRLGLLYRDGEHVEQDLGKAAHWFRKAAEQDLAQAMFELGVLYDTGRGVPLDRAKAETWFREAGRMDYRYEFYRIGARYEEGREGTPKDRKRAVDWYRKAVEEDGDERALARLKELGAETGDLDTAALEAERQAREDAEAEAAAEADTASPPVPVEGAAAALIGTWTGLVETSDGKFSVDLAFEDGGSGLAGTFAVTPEGGDRQAYPIEALAVDGEAVSFRVSSPDAADPDALHVELRRDGERLVGEAREGPRVVSMSLARQE